MRHPAEKYLEHFLPNGLSDLMAWDGIDEHILPIIEWDGLWHVVLARISLRDSPTEFSEQLSGKLTRLVQLSRAYAAYRAWTRGTEDDKYNVLALLHQKRVSSDDIRIIRRFFAANPAPQ